VAGRRPAGWGRLTQCSVDNFKNAFEVLIDFAVPKTQYAETRVAEMTITKTVAPGVVVQIVLTSIDLDNEPMLQACEVHDVAAFRSLTTKMKATAAP
jgi:hypothetical protein